MTTMTLPSKTVIMARSGATTHHCSAQFHLMAIDDVFFSYRHDYLRIMRMKVTENSALINT